MPSNNRDLTAMIAATTYFRKHVTTIEETGDASRQAIIAGLGRALVEELLQDLPPAVAAQTLRKQAMAVELRSKVTPGNAVSALAADLNEQGVTLEDIARAFLGSFITALVKLGGAEHAAHCLQHVAETFDAARLEPVEAAVATVNLTRH